MCLYLLKTNIDLGIDLQNPQNLLINISLDFFGVWVFVDVDSLSFLAYTRFEHA